MRTRLIVPSPAAWLPPFLKLTNPQLTILSMRGAAVANALYPTIGTANPSANVDSIGV